MGKLSELKDVIAPTKEVPVAGTDKTVTVRGLSLADLSVLLDKFSGEMEKVHTEYIEQSLSGEFKATKFVETLLIQTPDMVCTLIAHAAFAPDEVDTVKAMTVLDQINLIFAIAELTFRSEQDVKNLVERVGEIWSQTATALDSMNMQRPPIPSKAGSGISEDSQASA